MFEETPHGLYLPRGAGADPLSVDQEAHREAAYWEQSSLGGDWQGRVTVTRVTMRRTRRRELLQSVKFEVCASWFGPPMAGASFGPHDVEGHRMDSWWSAGGTPADGELAERVARQAADQLRHRQVPDLHALARAS